MRSALLRDGSVFALSVGSVFAAGASRSISAPAESSNKREPAQPTLPGLPPKTSMNLEQARKYVLTLVNRDRAEHGLAPVVMAGVANRAGQPHGEDMAEDRYTAHWGT